MLPNVVFLENASFYKESNTNQLGDRTRWRRLRFYQFDEITLKSMRLKRTHTNVDM